MIIIHFCWKTIALNILLVRQNESNRDKNFISVCLLSVPMLVHMSPTNRFISSRKLQVSIHLVNYSSSQLLSQLRLVLKLFYTKTNHHLSSIRHTCTILGTLINFHPNQKRYVNIFLINTYLLQLSVSVTLHAGLRYSYVQICWFVAPVDRFLGVLARKNG